MNKIFELFKEKSLSDLKNDFPEILKIDTLVWYPSSGYDYRHIFNDSISKKEDAKIYLHTDISALNSEYNNLSIGNPIFETKKFKTKYGGFLTCKAVYELELKNDLYHPSSKVLIFSIDKYTKHNGRVFCFLVSIDSDKNNLIPLIFASFENTNFFYDYILENNLIIDELVHINDGGQSLGGSRLKMDYIYLYLDKLGIKKIKLDYSLKIKLMHAVSDYGRFRYRNPLSQNKQFRIDHYDDFIKEELDKWVNDYNDDFIKKELDKWVDGYKADRVYLKHRLNRINQCHYLYVKKQNNINELKKPFPSTMFLSIMCSDSLLDAWPDTKPSTRPTISEIENYLLKLREKWKDILDKDFSSHTLPITFSGRKLRRLVVIYQKDYPTPLGFLD